MSTLEAPLKLGRTCSSWRSFAYSCPRLWARIHISVLHLCETPDSHDIDPNVYLSRMEDAMAGIRRRLDGVSEWLERSQPHPLSISVFEPRVGARNGPVLPVLQTLLPFSKQWQDLKLLITWDDSTMLECNQHFKLLEFPILRSVHLRSLKTPQSHFHWPSSLSPFKWFLTPSLRSFHALSLPSPLLVKLGIHRSTLRLKCLTFYEKVGFPVSLHLPNVCDLSFASDCRPRTSIPRFDLPGTPSTLHSLTTLTLDLITLAPEVILRTLSCASSSILHLWN